MRVLVACEFSGIVREAFRAKGHDAWSCDLIPSEIPGPHIVGDVLVHLVDGWDLMIAHPPCKYLSYAGMRYWNLPGREEKRTEAMRFFMRMIDAPIPLIAVENPVGWPCQVYRTPDQIIHPYFFGDRQLKRTCLWLKGLSKLCYWEQDSFFGRRTMTDFPEPTYTTQREHGIKKRFFAEAKHGSSERSRTFPAIARAMAEQWNY